MLVAPSQLALRTCCSPPLSRAACCDQSRTFDGCSVSCYFPDLGHQHTNQPGYHRILAGSFHRPRNNISFDKMIPRHKSSSAIEGEKGLFGTRADEITCADHCDANPSIRGENSGILSWHTGEDALPLQDRTNYVASHFSSSSTKKAGCTRCFDLQR